MPTRMIIGVSSQCAVTFIMARRPVLIKPVCSATPMPSMATRTTPMGWKCAKFCTIAEKNAASEAPDNWLTTASGSPVRGSITPQSP